MHYTTKSLLKHVLETPGKRFGFRVELHDTPCIFAKNGGEIGSKLVKLINYRDDTDFSQPCQASEDYPFGQVTIWRMSRAVL
jgi:hypothetical protein